MIDFLVFSGSIPARTQTFAIVVSGGLFLLIVYLIRSGRLKEGYSLIWFFIALATVALSVFSGLLDVFARFIGIAYVPAALFLVLLGGVYLLGIHFSLLLNRYDKRIRQLAQEHAILKEQIAKLLDKKL
ncbi:MAG: DUF2304 domain-containing protein [bacterium]|nr:DUF2304 domain-containing protein [bacterium]MDZ4346713.1 DUF2304 domain-containing protein [Candidatus Binatia bacterium]